MDQWGRESACRANLTSVIREMGAVVSGAARRARQLSRPADLIVFYCHVLSNLSVKLHLLVVDLVLYLLLYNCLQLIVIILAMFVST